MNHLIVRSQWFQLYVWPLRTLDPTVYLFWGYMVHMTRVLKWFLWFLLMNHTPVGHFAFSEFFPFNPDLSQLTRYVLCSVWLFVCLLRNYNKDIILVCMFSLLQAKFLPHSGDSTLAMCARDGQIRIAELSATQRCKNTKRVAQHKGAAHKVQQKSTVLILDAKKV